MHTISPDGIAASCSADGTCGIRAETGIAEHSKRNYNTQYYVHVHVYT